MYIIYNSEIVGYVISFIGRGEEDLRVRSHKTSRLQASFKNSRFPEKMSFQEGKCIKKIPAPPPKVIVTDVVETLRD